MGWVLLLLISCAIAYRVEGPHQSVSNDPYTIFDIYLCALVDIVEDVAMVLVVFPVFPGSVIAG